MLDQLAITLRALQLYAHNAHNNCKGMTFLPDHEFLAEIYTAAEGDYDSVVERMIGITSKPVDTLEIASKAVEHSKHLGKDPGVYNSNYFRSILSLELAICVIVDKCVASGKYSEGTNQLIGGIADKSMVRQYKIRQRLG